MTSPDDSGCGCTPDGSRGVEPPSRPPVHDGERLVYDEFVDLDRDPELSVTVVQAIAEIDELPCEVLDDVVDVDGLGRVFRFRSGTPRRCGWVTFFFAGYRITFDSDHRLRIYESRPESDLEASRADVDSSSS